MTTAAAAAAVGWVFVAAAASAVGSWKLQRLPTAAAVLRPLTVLLLIEPWGVGSLYISGWADRCGQGRADGLSGTYWR
jgi:hypothetical protein